MSDELRSNGVCESCGVPVAWEATTCQSCGATFDLDALVAVFATADAQLLPLLKSALVSAGIPHIVQGEGALGLFPLGPFATGLTRNLVAATIHVPRGHAPAAVEVLGGLAFDERVSDEDIDVGDGDGDDRDADS